MVSDPLLQHLEKIGVASSGAVYITLFHEKLMNLYRNHVILSRTLFPHTGFVEIDLAIGARMSQGGGI